MIYAAIAVAITIVATGCRQDKPAQGFLNPTSAQAATTRVSTADAARAKKAPLLYEIPAKLTDGSWLHFDFTPGEAEVRTGAAAPTGMLCVIGAELKEEAVNELFGVQGHISEDDD